ncbi:MAG: hypothetical protein PHV28_09430 [Kiritimatiellae bacterium]|nr:hypothetical protein [Kiritimatiellia bacterium]
MNRAKMGALIGGGVLAGLVCGAGLERLRQGSPGANPAAVEPLPKAEPVSRREPPPQTVVVKDEAALRTVEALRKRVAELEKGLAAREAELEQLNRKRQAEAASPQMPGRGDFRRRMEQFKKENPERYAEMEKQREEMRQRMERDKEERANFLASVNTQGMSENQKANHEKLLENLAKIEELRAQREQANVEPGSAADTEFHQAMRQTMTELGTLYEQERISLLEQAAFAAGYEGNDAATFVDYIQEAVQSTTMPWGLDGHGGGRPPRMP